MKQLSYFAAVMSLAAFAATSQAGVVATYDFNTDQSGSFSVHNGAGDYVANFSYDHSTYTPQTGTTGPTSIPSAPNGTGTTALRLEANNNDATAAADGVTVIPTAASGLSNFTMTFDMWLQYNGPAGGGSGSTEFIAYGGGASGSSVEWPNAASTSFFLTATGEGGAGQDYRFYQGSGSGAPTRTDSAADYFGSNQVDHGGAGWQALFPSSAYETAGAAGKAWTTVELNVTNGVITASMTPTGGTKTQVASFTPPATLTAGHPFISYFDVFTSIANPTADNFALVDNIVIEVPDASVSDWSVYE